MATFGITLALLLVVTLVGLLAVKIDDAEASSAPSAAMA